MCYLYNKYFCRITLYRLNAGSQLCLISASVLPASICLRSCSDPVSLVKYAVKKCALSGNALYSSINHDRFNLPLFCIISVLYFRKSIPKQVWPFCGGSSLTPGILTGVNEKLYCPFSKGCPATWKGNGVPRPRLKVVPSNKHKQIGRASCR